MREAAAELLHGPGRSRRIGEDCAGTQADSADVCRGSASRSSSAPRTTANGRTTGAATGSTEREHPAARRSRRGRTWCGPPRRTTSPPENRCSGMPSPTCWGRWRWPRAAYVAPERIRGWTPLTPPAHDVALGVLGAAPVTKACAMTTSAARAAPCRRRPAPSRLGAHRHGSGRRCPGTRRPGWARGRGSGWMATPSDEDRAPDGGHRGADVQPRPLEQARREPRRMALSWLPLDRTTCAPASTSRVTVSERSATVSGAGSARS